MMMPGRALYRLVVRCFGAETCERVLSPQLADFQQEFLTAKGYARLAVLIRGYAAFWLTFVACAPARLRTVAARLLLGDPSPLTLQFGVLVVFSLSLGAAFSWVRTGNVSATDMLMSLRQSPVAAFLPAFVAVRYRASRFLTPLARIAFALTLALSFAVIVAASSGGLRLYGDLAFATFLLATVIRRKSMSAI
jgi:hypothetical protein